MRMRTRVSQRRTIVVAASCGFLLAGLMTFWFFMNSNSDISAATLNDYRTKKSGNWNAASTWERYNGSSWINASSAPDHSVNVITVRNGHSVTTTNGQDVDQLIIEQGGTLLHNNGTLKIKKGNGDDITVNGTLTIESQFTLETSTTMVVNGTVNKNAGGFTIKNLARIQVNNSGVFKNSGGSLDTDPGPWNFNAGSTYEHADNSGTIPNANWDSGSTCLITGTTNSPPSNLNQTFGSVVWNTPSMTGTRNLNASLQSIIGNLHIVNTGSGAILMNSGNNQAVTIGGSFIQDGGSFYLTESGNTSFNIGGSLIVNSGTFNATSSGGGNGSGSPVLSINGNLELNGGTFDLNQYTGSNSSQGQSSVNIRGDLRINGGSLRVSSSTVGQATINMNGTSAQNFTNTGSISGKIHLIIAAGSVIDFDSTPFTGSGNFTLPAGATIKIGSPHGLSASSASGNIQVSGIRSYSTQANYVYDGTVAQVTGNGLPSSISNFTVDNSAGLLLSSNITVTQGAFLNSGIVSTGLNTLTIGSSVTNTGNITRTNGWVNGNLARWISSSVTGPILFPVGGVLYNGLTQTYTSQPSSGGIATVSFISNNPTTFGIPVMDANSYNVNSIGTNGYWTITASSGLSGGIASISLEGRGFSGFTTTQELRILSRTNPSSPWILSGTHADGTGSHSFPVGARTGISPYQQFALGWGYSALPIELMSFNVKPEGNGVLISWSTATEVNNDYFTIERSSDGREFNALTRVNGAGNSSTIKTYEYKDYSPLAGISYYRLRQTDYDGRFEVFDPKKINIKKSILSEESVSVWPNPFEDRINLDIHTEERTEVKISLFSIDGRMITSESVNVYSSGTVWSYNTPSNIKPGSYFIRVDCGEESITRKILKR